MAKSITQITKRIPNAVEEQAQAQAQILEAAAKNKDAILQLLDVVNDLKQLGVLDMAHAFITNSKQIGVIGITQLNKSGAQNLIKNGMGAMQFLGQLEPGKLEMLLGALAAGTNEAAGKPGQVRRVGLMGMLREMGNPDIKASLGFLLSFLRGLGKSLQRSPT